MKLSIDVCYDRERGSFWFRTRARNGETVTTSETYSGAFELARAAFDYSKATGLEIRRTVGVVGEVEFPRRLPRASSRAAVREALADRMS